MKKLKLNLDYKIEYGDNKPENIDKAYADLSKSYIDYAVTSLYKNGMSGSLRRAFGAIQVKIDIAIADSTYEIELDKKELDFLVDLFKNEKTEMPPIIARYVNVLEDAIFGL